MIKLTKKLNIIACLAFSTLALTSATPQLSTFAMEPSSTTESCSNINSKDVLIAINQINKLLKDKKPNIQNINTKKQYETSMTNLGKIYSFLYENHQKIVVNLAKSLENKLTKNQDMLKIVEKYEKILTHLNDLFNAQLKENLEILTKIESVKNSVNPIVFPFEGCSEAEKQFYYGFDKLCWYLFVQQKIIIKDIESIENHSNMNIVFNKNSFINECYAANLPDIYTERLPNFIDKDMLNILKIYENIPIKFKHFHIGEGYIHVSEDFVNDVKNKFNNILKSND